MVLRVFHSLCLLVNDSDFDCFSYLSIPGIPTKGFIRVKCRRHDMFIEKETCKISKVRRTDMILESDECNRKAFRTMPVLRTSKFH
jgi:hypothetical protein